MFTKLTSAYNLGIERYKAVRYTWESPLLRGRVSVLEEKPGEFIASAEPHLGRLRTIDSAGRSLSSVFNEARNTTLFLGQYESLDALESYIATLEGFFGDTLRERGAAQRVLRDGRLCATNQETAATFGEALKLARNAEIFTALRAGQPVSLEQVAGRLLRPLANALNVSYTQEVERHAENPQRHHSITYTFDRLATFIFLDNGADDFPTVIRRSYSEDKRAYQQTYTGPATLDNLQRHVFLWLADALRERTGEAPSTQAARVLRDLSFDELTAYAAPGGDELWRAIRRGERDDIFNGPAPVPRPDAMLGEYRAITGIPATSAPVSKAPFLRIIK